MDNVRTAIKFEYTSPTDEQIKAILEEFRKRFPNEEACWNEIFRQRQITRTMICYSCGSTDISHKDGSRKVKCKTCKRRFSLTANIFYERVRRIEDWLLYSIFLEHGVVLNPWRFSAIANSSYETAWKISKKILLVINTYMPEGSHRLTSDRFIDVIGRRSIETEKRQHPVTEESCFQSNHYDANQDSAEKTDDKGHAAEDWVPSESMSERERQICELLHNGPVHPDDLCGSLNTTIQEISVALLFMELSGIVKQTDGGRFTMSAREQHSEHRETVTSITMINDDLDVEIVRNTIKFVRKTHQSVSRKYLQPFLTEVWFLSDRDRWTEGSVVRACVTFRPIRPGEIRNYVTPAVVNVAA